MCIGILSECMCESVVSPGTGVSDSCELPCGSLELNSEQTVLLTAESSL